MIIHFYFQCAWMAMNNISTSDDLKSKKVIFLFFKYICLICINRIHNGIVHKLRSLKYLNAKLAMKDGKLKLHRKVCNILQGKYIGLFFCQKLQHRKFLFKIWTKDLFRYIIAMIILNFRK